MAPDMVLPYDPLALSVIDLPLYGYQANVQLPDDYSTAARQMMDEVFRQMLMVNRAEGMMKRVMKHAFNFCLACAFAFALEV